MKKIKRMSCYLLLFTMVITIVSPCSKAQAKLSDWVSAFENWWTDKQDESSYLIDEMLESITATNQKIQEYRELVDNINVGSSESYGIMNYISEKSGHIYSGLKKVECLDELNWNQNMIAIKSEEANQEPSVDAIKVAIIDSGVNFCEDIDVAERKNFIPEEEDISPIFEDFSGHGTNIAGIIAAKDNGVGITGINPNVDIYSAKVLDRDMIAPISRVVKAIDWAIEMNVNIINLSFTTTTDSPTLREAIKRAYDSGILIVAAAGNEEYLAYPAAYPEVIAVGSVNSEGEISKFSPSGNGVELVAPGELITSTDVFNTLSTNSGTSYAAPHVTAIASKLWERDRTVSGNYIRTVLDISANLYYDDASLGYGLVDYEFACQVFDCLKPFAKICDSFAGLMRYAVEICNIRNVNDVPVIDEGDTDIVNGAWYLDDDGAYAHRTIFDGLNTKNANGRALIMAGCCINDYDITGTNNIVAMKETYYHGGTFNQSRSYAETNYLASAIYLTRVAKNMVRGVEYNSSNASSLLSVGDFDLCGNTDNTYVDKYAGLKWSNSSFIKQIEGYPWSKKTGTSDVNADFSYTNTIHRGLVLYGMALHHIADIFSHSSVTKLRYDSNLNYYVTTDDTTSYRPAIIRHITIDGVANAADSLSIVPERFYAATYVCQNALRMISNMSDTSNTSTSGYSGYNEINLSIFDLSSTNYANEVQLAYFADYAQQVCDDPLFSSTNTWDDAFYDINPSTFYDANRSIYLNSIEE